jgi:transcriptional antiterminator NusG
VQTGGEEKLIKRFRTLYPDIFFPIHLAKRKLKIKRKGKQIFEERSVFPGYLFLEIDEADFGPAVRFSFRHTPGFYKFLPANERITPMSNDDVDLIKRFITKGSPELNTVTFDEHSRIVIKSGPLKGLEGRIIKVDRRKKRVKVSLDLYRDSFAVDFGFEEVVGGS